MATFKAKNIVCSHQAINVRHHKVGEVAEPAMYRIKDDLVITPWFFNLSRNIVQDTTQWSTTEEGISLSYFFLLVEGVLRWDLWVVWNELGALHCWWRPGPVLHDEPLHLEDPIEWSQGTMRQAHALLLKPCDQTSDPSSSLLGRGSTRHHSRFPTSTGSSSSSWSTRGWDTPPYLSQSRCGNPPSTPIFPERLGEIFSAAGSPYPFELQIPVRPFRHNEYERFIPAAYPYYGASFSTVSALHGS